MLYDPPLRPLTVAEYAALDGTAFGYTELVEGRPLLSPAPGSTHDIAAHELFVQLRAQLAGHLEVLREFSVDLGLAAADEPGFVRRPDLVVAGRGAASRAREARRLLHASEVLVAIEVTSHGSVRTDYITKRSEYADADIPYYWLVDIDESVSLLSCEQPAELGYLDSGEHRREFTTDDPVNVRLRLDELV